MKNKIILLTAVTLLLVTLQSRADVKLPRIFSSGMVLQQGMEIPVWGWASPNEKIVVSFNGKTVSTRADQKGNFKVKLPAQSYGGPFTLTIKGQNTLVFNDVMIGEVWVCSGQSNMQWSVSQSNHADTEISTAGYPNIRLFQVPLSVAQFPQNDITAGEWKVCSPETVDGFSAVGYFFGRDLHQKLQVPVGLIQTAWGGTVAETWISSQTIENDPDFNELLDDLHEMDLARYREQKMEQIKKILGGKIPTEDQGIVNGVPVWSAIDLDDGDWKTICSPQVWEEQGYAEIDGVAWYRKEIYLSEEQSQSNITLHLGKIDDADITWLNGIEIGKTDTYDQNRIYTIDSKYLKPGKNMLVVRVDDTGGNGGMWGAPEEQFLAIGKERIDISGDWKFRISKASVQSVNVGPNSYPTLLFNAMINPIVPYAIKGAIWYQGESNADRAQQYRRVFPSLITDWRRHWGQGDFPFLFVSLANFREAPLTPGESTWAELREAQTQTLSLPNTGMALAIDIGDANDIHPRNKQDVGKRLALNALKTAYHQNVVCSGPMFRSVQFVNNKAVVTFDQVAARLVAKDKYGYVKGFTLAGEDKKFYWAPARLLGNNQVEISCEQVKNPVAVRYGWADNPDDVNLYNSEGLPANPFRTDNWPGITR